MPMPAHMELTGENQGKIDGSCSQQGREDTILIEAMNHMVRIPRDPQTGLATGKRVHEALTTGEHFSEVFIKWYRIDPTGAEEHYFTHKLEDAILVDIKPWMPNCLDPGMGSYTHMEDLSFTYRKIIWTWEPDGIEAEDDWEVPK
jgi:type VI secretion system secreted protein Hcp